MNEIDPEKLNASNKAVEQRLREQARRESIRGILERMTLLFELPVPGHLWSRTQILFFGESAALISILTRRLPRLF